MTNPKPEILPVPEAIRDVREAMENLRLAQRASGFAIERSRFDAEAEPVNQAFLQDITDALPLEFAGLDDKEGGGAFTLDDPVYLRSLSAFGVTDNNPYKTGGGGFVIGQRPATTRQKYPLTEVLLATKDGKGNAKVMTAIVDGKAWAEHLDEAISKMSEPFPYETLKSLLVNGKYVVKKSQCAKLGVPALAQIYKLTFDDEWVRVTKKDLVDQGRGGKYYAKKLHRNTDKKRAFIGATAGDSRPLDQADFEDFSVMTHIEYLAAAFGIGEELDRAKAKREAAMPVHPYETAFGLPDYRRTMEMNPIADTVES